MKRKIVIAILTITFTFSVMACKSDVEKTTENSTASAKVVSQGIQLREDYNLHYVDAYGEWHDTTINANLKMHPYDFSKLENDGQNISYDDGTYTIRHGIDVSHHQGAIDWEKVKADGYDPESIRDDEARTDELTGEQATINTIVFCERIKKAGYESMVYSNMVWESDYLDMYQIEQYPKWYADYEKIPQTPYDFTFWQYSEKGNVDGIIGPVDLDVWFVGKKK